MRGVYNGLSDIGILPSQNGWAFKRVVDWNCLPVAELYCHYLQNDRQNQIQSWNLYKWCMRSIMIMNALIKYIVQTATAPPT